MVWSDAETWTLTLAAIVAAVLFGRPRDPTRQLPPPLLTAPRRLFPAAARPLVHPEGWARALSGSSPTTMASRKEVWLLGHRYGPFKPEEANHRWGHQQRFLRHLRSRLWFTYRTGSSATYAVCGLGAPGGCNRTLPRSTCCSRRRL